MAPKGISAYLPFNVSQKCILSKVEHIMGEYPNLLLYCTLLLKLIHNFCTYEIFFYRTAIVHKDKRL